MKKIATSLAVAFSLAGPYQSHAQSPEITTPGAAATKAAYEKVIATTRAQTVQKLSDDGAASSAFDSLIAEIEARLLDKDVSAATKLLESSKLHWKEKAPLEAVIEYFERLDTFRSLTKSPEDAPHAVTAYARLVQSYNNLPETIPFSQYLAGFIEGSIRKSEEFINKSCGSDYMKIKVGMKLSKVQKCYGEFYLRGQTKSKFGTVDHYSRGETWLLVQKGKIIAWGD